MALTPSTMMPLGTIAPSFRLKDVRTNEFVEWKKDKGFKGFLAMFICNHCPYVKHIQKGLVELGRDYSDKIQIVGISSNDVVGYPEDSPQKMKEVAAQWNYPFAYLFDEDQSVAKAYKAACTPDFFLFDSELRCFYRGQMDDSRPGNGIEVSGKNLREAIEALMAGKNPPENQKPSIGCNIKFKK